MPKFEKLRISLASDPHTELFGEEATAARRTRQEFLQTAFGESRTFLGARGRQTIGFDPIPCQDGYVAGFFKRERPIPARRKDLHAYSAENYELAVFVMSIEKDQICWMQHNPKLGTPKAILKYFFEHLASKTDLREWRPEARYMDTKGEYFTALKLHESRIAFARFTFLPPNALGGDDKVRAFVKEIQAEAHPHSQSHTYRGPPGSMNMRSDLMEASARVAMEGGGDAELKDAQGKYLYRSDGARTVEDIPEEDLPTPENNAFIKRVIMRLFGIKK